MFHVKKNKLLKRIHNYYHEKALHLIRNRVKNKNLKSRKLNYQSHVLGKRCNREKRRRTNPQRQRKREAFYLEICQITKTQKGILCTHIGLRKSESLFDSQRLKNILREGEIEKKSETSPLTKQRSKYMDGREGKGRP